MSTRTWDCVCGYSSKHRQGLHQHRKTCKVLAGGETKQLQNQVAQMQQQLTAKDEHYQKELAAKDRQIEELIKANKKPRTVNTTNNNRYVVEQHINVFGKETLGHITPEQIQRLLADPENAVAKFVKLKHRAPSNANVRCPNVNRAIYQVVVDAAGLEGEEKEWENQAKGDVLERLYDDNSSILEGEAMEDEHLSFLDHQDKVKASAAANAADGGRCYKKQLDKIHNVIIS
jgi:hypothetical protein